MNKFQIFSLTLILTLASATGHSQPGDYIFRSSFEGNFVPEILEIDVLGGIATENFSHQLQTVPGSPRVDVWSIVSGPTGLTVDPLTGVLSWLPGFPDVGEHRVVVTATTDSKDADTEGFDLHILNKNSPPVIGAIADQGVVADSLFNFTIPASDPDAGDVLDYGLITAPAGMSMGALSGLLTWTPSMADIGDHAVTVSVTDPAGISDNASLVVSVYASNTPPVLNAVASQGAQMGETFSLMLEANDADGDTLDYALTQRPAGMSINAQSGVISWTPLATAQGQAMVTAEVRDGKGGTDSDSFVIAVDQNYAPVAVDDHYTVERGETLMVSAPGVLGNDIDINFDPLTAQLETDVNAGALSLQSDGSFEYTPDNPTSALGFVEKFAVPSPYGGPTSIPTIADMDGDGFTDLVVNFSSGVANIHKLLVVRGDNGDVIYEPPEFDRSIHIGTGTNVLADIDLDGRLEIIAIGAENGGAESQMGRKLIAMEHDGTFKWISDPIPEKGIHEGQVVTQTNFRNSEISIADLDQDGTPEIVIATAQRGGTSNGIGVVVFDNQGKLLFTRYARANFKDIYDDARVEIVDLDLDGDLEILIKSAAFSHTGEALWHRTDLFNRSIRSTPIAVNLDNDPYPELVRAKDDNEIIALNHDGSTAWLASTGLGMNLPLLAADIDDDGLVEVISANSSGSASGGRVDVLNGIDGTLKWQYPPAEEPRLEFLRTSPVVLDIDRDGSTEVLVFTRSREIHLLNGSDGSLINIWDLGIGQASDVNVPVFADVDHDGASELVLAGTSSFTAGETKLVRVFEAPDDDWLPTGSIYNQANFHVTNINPDGTVPQFERPHWLIPGLNQNHLNGLLPEERVATTDAFTYLANDGELDSNIATVNIDVLPPNSPPQILSSPRLLASPGFEYFYPMLVVDGDVGETLTYQLVDGPPGMSIDASGQITWTPAAGDLGEHPVVVTVTDSFGYSDTQYFSVMVQSPSTVPDVLGLTESNAIDSLEALDLRAGAILEIYSLTVAAGQVASQDPVSGTVVAAGTPIGLEVSVGPAPVPVPRLVSLDINSALAAISTAGLNVGNLVYVNSQELPTGGVLQQSPPPNADAAPGSAVDLVVSGGPRFVIQVSPSVIPSGESASVQTTVYTNEGLAESPQPAIDMTIEFVPDNISGPLPVIAGGSLTTSVNTAGEFVLRASINGGGETSTEPFVVLPPIADGPLGTIYTDFALQLETFSRLIKELQAAIDANDTPAIISLDLQLQALAADIDLKRLRGTTPMAPEGGVPPDPDTALTMGFLPAAQDDAYLQSATTLAATLDDMRVLLDDNNSPDVFIQTLNQQLMQQANALIQFEPSTHGVLTANGVLVNMLSARIPELVVADINAIHTSLVDAGVVSASPQNDDGLQSGSGPSDQFNPGQLTGKGRKNITFFSLPSVMGAVGIRNQIINDIYLPIIGDLVISSLFLVIRDGLVRYANAGHLYGIITASSQSIHVFDVAGSIAEGEGFELYPPANTTIMISPQKITEAIEILESIPDAEDLKAINEIAEKLKALADSLVSEPQDVLRGCFLDTSPTCRQLIYDKGFESVYESGGLALPAPTLIVVHGAATGSLGVFVAAFLPTEPEED